MAVAAEDAVLFQNVLPTGDAVRQVVLAHLTVQVVLADRVRTEGTRSLGHFRNSVYRPTRDRLKFAYFIYIS